jgi:hypothetical protein
MIFDLEYIYIYILFPSYSKHLKSIHLYLLFFPKAQVTVLSAATLFGHKFSAITQFNLLGQDHTVTVDNNNQKVNILFLDIHYACT